MLVKLKFRFSDGQQYCNLGMVISDYARKIEIWILLHSAVSQPTHVDVRLSSSNWTFDYYDGRQYCNRGMSISTGPSPGPVGPAPLVAGAASQAWLFCKQVELYGRWRCCKRRVAAGLVSPPTLPAKASSKEVACQRCLNSKKGKQRSHHQDFRL